MKDNLIKRLEMEKLIDVIGLNKWQGQMFFLTFRLSNKTQETKTIEAAAANYRHFLNRLNRQVFGSGNKNKPKKLRRRINQAAAVQANLSKSSIHIHCLLEKPSHIKSTDFIDQTKKCWLKTKYGYLGRKDSGFAFHIVNKTEEQIFNHTKYIFTSRVGSDAFPLDLSI